MAKISNATNPTVTGLQWFKIAESGLTGTTWAVDTMITNQGKVSFTIPSCIPAGQYLLRHEIIALHNANSYPGAQFYVEWLVSIVSFGRILSLIFASAQITVTGGGSTTPTNTVSFPGAYKGALSGPLLK
jgi:hypothetical protein